MDRYNLKDLSATQDVSISIEDLTLNPVSETAVPVEVPAAKNELGGVSAVQLSSVAEEPSVQILSNPPPLPRDRATPPSSSRSAARRGFDPTTPWCRNDVIIEKYKKCRIASE